MSAVDESNKNNEGEVTGDSEPTVASLKHQLATLTSSLYTVTEQKSKMEATYVSEKRKFKVKYDVLLFERQKFGLIGYWLMVIIFNLISYCLILLGTSYYYY